MNKPQIILAASIIIGLILCFTCTIEPELSSNANLSGLILSNGTLAPGFSTGITDYTASVGYSISSITITATGEEPAFQTIQVSINNGNWQTIQSGIPSMVLGLNTGTNTVFIRVTAQDSSTKIYTITITRAELSSNALLSNLAISSGTLEPEFSSTTTDYSVTVGNAVTEVTVTPTSADPDHQQIEVRINSGAWESVVSSQASSSLSLIIGLNTIEIQVIAEDESANIYTIVVTRLSNNADLSDLDISAGTLSPAFTSDTTNYNVSVPNNITYITVTPTQADVNAQNIGVRINSGTWEPVISGQPSGNLNLNVGINTIEIEVTAQDGTEKIYTINVTRAASSNADLSSLLVSQGTLTPGFTSNVTDYSISVMNTVTGMTVTPTQADINAQQIEVRINVSAWELVISGQPSSNLNLNVGANTIEVRVTAQVGTEKIYSILATRAGSSNALLSDLTVSSGTLTPAFSPFTNAYNVSVSNSTADISIYPTVDDINSTYELQKNAITATNPIPLDYGNNVITIIVSAQDSSTNTYTISVTRALSTNADLSDLVISAGVLSPAFNSFVTSYSITVSNATATVTATPTLDDPNAQMIEARVNSGAWETVASSQASNSLGLNVGDNIIDVRVTAQDGTTVKTYSINARRLSGNANLSALSISSGILVPSFASGITNYSDNVLYSVSSVTVTPVIEDANASSIEVQVNSGGYTVVTSGAQSGSLLLNVGNNTVEIRVTAEDASITQIYTITVSRVSPSTNANLSLVTLSAGTLTPVFSGGTTDYTSTISSGTTSLTVTPTLEDTNATGIEVRVNGGGWTPVTSGTPSGSLGMNFGNNTIEIQVTAEDGTTTKTYTISVYRLNNNANLSSLTISDGTLNPAFASGTTTYTDTVSPGISTITVTPALDDPGATGIEARVNGGGWTPVISGSPSGNLDLNFGNNTIEILVTAEDGAITNTYTITVYRISNNANLSGLAISAGTLTPAFSSETITYTDTVSSTVTSVTVIPILEDPGASGIELQFNGGGWTPITSGNPSGSLVLLMGSNSIEVQVTAEDGTTTKLYTISVYRLNNNANLSSLNISAGTLTPAFSSGTISYTDTVTNGTTAVTVTPTQEDTNAQGIDVQVNGGGWTAVTSGSPSGSLALNIGDNTIEIRVTAEDGITEKTYSILVHRISNNANLSALTISAGTLTPAFSSGTTTYSDNVPYAATSVTVTPTQEDGNATGIEIQFNGGGWAPIGSGSPSGNLGLAVGDNTVEIRVTAEDGITTRTYTITVRRLNNNATLSSLTLSNGMLRPPFYKNRAHYITSVPNSTTSVTVTPTSEDSNAIIQVQINSGGWSDVTSGQASGGLSLNTGSNALQVRVTAEDPSINKTYFIDFRRESPLTGTSITWQNPSPQGNDLNDVYFPDTSNGWAVGSAGTIIKTTDGGATWVIQDSGITNELNAVFFINATTGWAAGDYGIILHTTDGGTNWTTQNSGTTVFLSTITFLDSSTGYTVGGLGTILKTIDGGTNWVSQTTGTTNSLLSVSFINSNTGWAAGFNGTIITTGNGGTNWVSQTSGVTNMFHSICFVDSNNGWIVGDSGMVMYSPNGGINWIPQTSGTTDWLYEVYFVNSTTGWFVGMNGTLKKTIDGGTTWTDQSSGLINTQLNAVYFYDLNIGWVVGSYGGPISKTTNGGANWTPQSSGNRYGLYSIYFIDSTTGWVAEDFYEVLETNDGGNTWGTEPFGIDNWLKSVFFVSDQTGWAVGRNGSIFKTTNGADYWTSQDSGITNELFSVNFIDEDTGWIVGNGGVILNTTDGGTNWTIQTSGITENLKSVFFIDNIIGWAVGWSGRLLHTIDGGNNWDIVASGTTYSLLSVYFINSTTGWISMSNGNILKTTDGGTNWVSYSSSTTNGLDSIYFLDTNNGWAAGSYGTLCKTTDGGNTWVDQFSGTDQPLFSIFFIDSKTGWAVSYDGIILKYEPQ